MLHKSGRVTIVPHPCNASVHIRRKKFQSLQAPCKFVPANAPSVHAVMLKNEILSGKEYA